MKHKHAELIKKWADGAEIERNVYGKWVSDPSPEWMLHVEYREKTEKPDFAIGARVIYEPQEDGSYLKFSNFGKQNVEFLFDGTTQKLKALRRLPE